MKFFKLLRPSHWSKNIFVFAALLFGRKLIGTPEDILMSIANALGAFVCFCLASSSMYIINDIVDRNSDKTHPQKKNRPIASGQISISQALVLAFICGALAIAGSYMLVNTFAFIIVAYLFITVLYSLFLKEFIIVDVIIISLGFVLRAVAGAVVVGVWISPWLIICTFALCLFMGFGKRYGEVLLLSQDGVLFRKTLGGYTPELLNHMLNVTSGLAIICFLLYSMDERTVRMFGTNNLIFTVPFVIYCIFRFSALIQKGQYSGPVQVLTLDRPFQVGFLLWVLACMLIIYANKFGISLSNISAY